MPPHTQQCWVNQLEVSMSQVNAIVPFRFYGDDIEVVKDGETLWISIRRICESLDIDVKTQHRKLQESGWARIVTMLVHDASNRQQDALLVDINTLPMWMATVSASRVPEHVRPKLIAYQREKAATVLANHFLKKTGQRVQQEDIDLLGVPTTVRRRNSQRPSTEQPHR